MLCLRSLYARVVASREIANPYGDLKQNKFLQKTITVDVKNLDSTCEAYQEVLGMIAMRDQLLFEVMCFPLPAIWTCLPYQCAPVRSPAPAKLGSLAV